MQEKLTWINIVWKINCNAQILFKFIQIQSGKIIDFCRRAQTVLIETAFFLYSAMQHLPTNFCIKKTTDVAVLTSYWHPSFSLAYVLTLKQLSFFLVESTSQTCSRRYFLKTYFQNSEFTWIYFFKFKFYKFF